METIIQQIAKKLINKILEKAYSGGISDIDALSSAVLGDCKEAAVDCLPFWGRCNIMKGRK